MYEEYLLECHGSRRWYEKYKSKEELVKALKYYGIPESLSDFSKTKFDEENGYAENKYQYYSVCAYK